MLEFLTIVLFFLWFIRFPFNLGAILLIIASSFYYLPPDVSREPLPYFVLISYIAYLTVRKGKKYFTDAIGRKEDQGAPSVVEPPNSSDQPRSSSTSINRELAAIMFTDIFGFSKEMSQDEERMFLKLQTHNKIIRDSLAKFDGKEIKTMGDAFLLKFSVAINAVRCAIECQQEFRRYNDVQSDESSKILVRIGIHVGDVLLVDNDVLGDGVNVAARIEPQAEPGGICISADVYNLVRKQLGTHCINIGRKELKNISDAPELYKVVIDAIL